MHFKARLAVSIASVLYGNRHFISRKWKTRNHVTSVTNSCYKIDAKWRTKTTYRMRSRNITLFLADFTASSRRSYRFSCRFYNSLESKQILLTGFSTNCSLGMFSVVTFKITIPSAILATDILLRCVSALNYSS